MDGSHPHYSTNHQTNTRSYHQMMKPTTAVDLSESLEWSATRQREAKHAVCWQLMLELLDESVVVKSFLCHSFCH